MTWSKLVSIHGRRLFIDRDDQIVGRAHVGGKHDGPGVILDPGGADIVAKSHDFVDGDTGDHVYASGDTGQSSSKIANTNGVWRLFNSPSATSTLASGGAEEIHGPALEWKADQGPGEDGRLHLGARVKITNSVSRTTNRLHAFIGFKDVASIEHPAYDTGAGIISASADYVGFVYSPGGDTGWSGVAGKSTAGDSGDQVTALDTGVEANTYDFLEVIVSRSVGDTGGVAHFFVNGQPKGSITSPVASSTALTWCVSAFQQDTGSQALDIDLVNVSALRDTGE